MMKGADRIFKYMSIHVNIGFSLMLIFIHIASYDRSMKLY